MRRLGGVLLGTLAVLTGIGAFWIVLGAGRPPSSTAAQVEQPSQRVISVTGEGKVSVTPDTAILTIGAEIFDPDPAVAQRELERRIDAMVAVFRQAGIPEQSIKTVVYSLTVERDWQQPSGPITGYRVTHLLEVHVRPIDQLGELLGRAVQAGANSVTGISFSVANPAPALRQARELAVRDALEKAAQLAQFSGVGLGRPVRISESLAAPPIPVVGAGGGSDAKVLPIGELTITVNVAIDYAIQ